MSDKIFRHKLVVRYFETDQMHFVYYAHYLVWFEAARTDMLQQLGLTYSRFEELGYFLPVAEAYCKYISPAHYEDNIIVEARVEELKAVSMVISYRIIREKDNKLLATGYTRHPCVKIGGKIARFPEEFTKLFE